MRVTFAAQHMACTTLIAPPLPRPAARARPALYSTLGYGVPGVIGGVAGGLLSERFGLAGGVLGGGAGGAGQRRLLRHGWRVCSPCLRP